MQGSRRRRPATAACASLLLRHASNGAHGCEPLRYAARRSPQLSRRRSQCRLSTLSCSRLPGLRAWSSGIRNGGGSGTRSLPIAAAAQLLGGRAAGAGIDISGHGWAGPFLPPRQPARPVKSELQANRLPWCAYFAIRVCMRMPSSIRQTAATSDSQSTVQHSLQSDAGRAVLPCAAQQLTCSPFKPLAAARLACGGGCAVKGRAELHLTDAARTDAKFVLGLQPII